MQLGETVVHMGTIISPSFIKIDEKQERFINSLFFCSEFQSVSRILKIVHSALLEMNVCECMCVIVNHC